MLNFLIEWARNGAAFGLVVAPAVALLWIASRFHKPDPDRIPGDW